MAEEPIKTGENRNPDGTFGPGNNANPKGRPKGSVSIADAIRRELENYPIDKDGNTSKQNYAELIAKRLLVKALTDKDISAIREIIDRVDGKPRQSVDLGGSMRPDVIHHYLPSKEKKTDDPVNLVEA